MGMFDYVNVSVKCPICGKIINRFQTKDGDNNMNLLEVGEVNNFYSDCTNCNTTLEFTRKNKIEKLMPLDDLKKDFDVKIQSRNRVTLS